MDYNCSLFKKNTEHIRISASSFNQMHRNVCDLLLAMVKKKINGLSRVYSKNELALLAPLKLMSPYNDMFVCLI